MLNVLDQEVSSRTYHLEQLVTRVSDLRAQAAKPDSNQMLNALWLAERERKLEEEILDRIERRMLELRTNLEAPSRVRLLQRATVEVD